MIESRPLPWLMALSLSLGAVAAGHAQRSAPRARPLEDAAVLQRAFTSLADEVFPSIVCLTAFERRPEAPPGDERGGIKG